MRKFVAKNARGEIATAPYSTAEEVEKALVRQHIDLEDFEVVEIQTVIVTYVGSNVYSIFDSEEKALDWYRKKATGETFIWLEEREVE